MEKKLPNLIIIGTFKAGTSALFKYLTDHKNVFKPAEKEIHYFTPLVYNSSQLKPLDHYTGFFQKYKGEELVVPEASPAYFYGGVRLIKEMKKILPPDHRVILMLRDPTQRFVSYYKHLKSLYLIQDDFETFFKKCHEAHAERVGFKIGHYSNAIEEGIYINYLVEWIESYGDKLKIIFFEDFVNDTRTNMENLSDWLNIDGNFYSNYNFRTVNKSQKTHSRSFHKIAVGTNKIFKKILNDSHRDKLISLYSSLNVQESPFEIDQKYIEKLNSIYAEPNKKLSGYLNNDMRQIPIW